MRNKRLLLIVFGAAIAVSHYSIMFIYLAFVVFIYTMSRIRRDPDPVLDGRMVLLFLVMGFSWFTLAYAPLLNLVQFLAVFVSSFSADIYSSSARITTVGLTQPVSLVTNTMAVGIFAVANLFVVIGIVVLILKPKITGINSKYRLLAIISAIILLLCFAVPNFAPALNLTRYYGITLLFLAPFFALGFQFLLSSIKTVCQKAFRRNISSKKYLRLSTSVICIILIFFLLTQSGFINRAAGSPPLLRTLDLDRVKASNDPQVALLYYDTYLTDQNVVGATWLSAHLQSSSQFVYVDYFTNWVLSSYGLIPYHQRSDINNVTSVLPGAVLYLNPLNINYGLISTTGGNSFNMSENPNLTKNSDTIYSSGEIQIQYKPA